MHKTTLEVPEELWRSIKAQAALDGRKLTAMVIEALEAYQAKMKTKKRPRRR